MVSVIGSLSVLTVNGWMNDPQGFDIVNGQITNIRPWEALFNGFFWHELAHMYFAGYMVTGFIVGGVYAVAYLKVVTR